MENSGSANQSLWEEQQRVVQARNLEVNRLVLRNFFLVLGAIVLVVAIVELMVRPGF